MHAGKKRLRPIMMTTFALIAGMLPVAIGLGEGGEFYRPMAVTIIGGTITSTMLTLLEFFAFLTTLRFFWRAGRRAFGLPTGGPWRKSQDAAGPGLPAAPPSEPVFNP